jgi:transcriptional regulator with XRE-family HTH domain
MDIYARILEARESLKTMNLPTKPVGVLLKEWIDKKGMNIYSLSCSSGVSNAQIARILQNSVTRPKFETMVAFCIGLGLTYEESMIFFRDAGYYDFENENLFHNDIVLYTMILRTPGIDLVHANILLILGMYELIDHENSISWMPSLLPSSSTAAYDISRKYPQVSPSSIKALLERNVYSNSDEIRDTIEKLEAIVTEWEKSNE